MEVILWIVQLGFAILVTAVVVSLYYRRKYAPIFCQLSELLADNDFGETDKTTEKSGKKTNKTTEKTAKKTDETDSISRKTADETGKTIDNPIIIAKNETGEDDKFMRRFYEKLFKQLTDAIRDEQLYTTPKFGRSDIMKRFHLTGKRVSTAFSMAGTSVPEFIRECRLEHARQLIIERPDMTLVEIATASGFVHASTFTVDFKNKYGVSPTKYREELRVKN